MNVNLRDDSFGGICSFIGCVGCPIACAFGMVCGVCRAKRGSRNRTLFTKFGLTGAILVRTFDTGICVGMKAGGGIAVTDFGITGITTFDNGGSCAFTNNFDGSTITGCDDDDGGGGCATATVDNCFCVAANSSSSFRFFNSNSSRCFICNSV